MRHKRASQEPKPEMGFKGCFVYFISTDDVPDFPIKIGFAISNVAKRLKALQTACPYQLVVLAAVEATTTYEMVLHCQLREFRLNGEWFRRTPEVLGKVAEALENQSAQNKRQKLLQMSWDRLPEHAKRAALPKVERPRDMPF